VGTLASGKITKRSVDAALPMPTSDTFLWDDELRGFGLKVTSAGSKSFVYQYRMGGRESKTRRWTIGAYGSPWTPSTARSEAERIAKLVGQGIDPIDADRERRRQAVDLAFATYSIKFEASCVGAGWKRMVERTLRIHTIPVLGNKPIPLITRADISDVLDRLPAGQQALRRNTFAVLRRLFRWAMGRGDLERSPCEGMETPAAVKARDRVLDDGELSRVWFASADAGRLFGPIVRLLIVTGQRRGEVTGLSWEEVNRANRCWTLPGARSKNGEAHVIPLGDLATAILDGVAGSENWPKRGIIFATSGGKVFAMHAKGKKKLDRLIAEDGHAPLSHWRLHDFRRTLATGFQRLGVRFEVTEAVLNHLSGSRSGVAGVYQRHNWTEEKRVALAKWEGFVTNLISCKMRAANAAGLPDGDQNV